MMNIFSTLTLKIDKIVLAAIALGFLAFFFILAANNRPVSEDFEFIRVFRQQGWSGSLFFSFNEHSFRLPSKVIFNIFFGNNIEFLHLNHFILAYHFATFSLLVFAVYKLFRSVAELLFKSAIPSKLILLYSILWIGAFFFGTFQVSETWFWLISSTIHLLSCIFGIIGIAFLLKKSISILDIIILVISFAFAGGSSENFALFLILLLGLFTIFLYFNKNRKEKLRILFKNIYRKTILSLTIVSISFIINLSGKGTSKRIINQGIINAEYASLPNKNSDKINEYSFSNFQKAIFNYKNCIALLFLVTFYFLGIFLRQKGITYKFKINKNLKKNILKIFSLILLLVLISTVSPLLYVFHGPGPLRAWTPISLVFALAGSTFFFQLGYSTKSIILKSISRFSIYLLFTVLVLYSIRQYHFVTQYSTAYDNRSNYLMDINRSGNSSTIDLVGLPDSGYLPSGDITHDENNILNKNYQFVLGLNFKVKSSDNYFFKFQ